MWNLAHRASPFTTPLSADYASSTVAGQGYLSPIVSDGTAGPETHARTCLHTPGHGPSARSRAPSHLILAGRPHHGSPLTHGSMTAWSDSAPWPVCTKRSTCTKSRRTVDRLKRDEYPGVLHWRGCQDATPNLLDIWQVSRSELAEIITAHRSLRGMVFGYVFREASHPLTLSCYARLPGEFTRRQEV